MSTYIRNPHVTNVLDISTGHITKHDTELLDESDGNNCPAIAYKYAEGYFVYCGDKTIDFDDFRLHGFSPSFVAVLRFANSIGCKHIQFDRDGTTYDDLPSYCW